MTDFDFDRELARALRGSPDDASPGFTRRVLTGLDGRPRRRFRTVAPLLAAAVLILALTSLPSVRRAFTSGETAPAAQAERREELLREYRALEKELDQIRRIAREQQPVLYLGGDEDFDVVYDLATQPLAGSIERPRPAALPDRG